jgi:hypothetical protein
MLLALGDARQGQPLAAAEPSVPERLLYAK